MNINLLSKRTSDKLSSYTCHKLHRTFQRKKIGKIISKERRSKRIVKDWNSFSKNTYARLLLQFSMNNIPFQYYFLEVLSDAINRTPKQIYTYHCKMLNEHGSIKQIIVNMLGYKVETKKQELLIITSRNQSIQKTSLSYMFDQVQLNNNQQKTLDSGQISYLHNLVLSDNLPQDCKYEFDLNEVQVLDFDDQQSYQQQSNTADNQYSSIQSESEQDIVASIQTQEDFFFFQQIK